MESESYNSPELMTEKLEINKSSKLRGFDFIKSLALQNKIHIKEPKQSCNKCYGRGFIGTDMKTHNPIPCKCIFRGLPQVGENQVFKNYKQRRREKIIMNKKSYKKMVAKLEKKELLDIKSKLVDAGIKIAKDKGELTINEKANG